MTAAMLLCKILILFILLPVLSFAIYVAPRREDKVTSLSFERDDKRQNTSVSHLHVINSELFHDETRSKRCVDLLAITA